MSLLGRMIRIPQPSIPATLVLALALGCDTSPSLNDATKDVLVQTAAKYLELHHPDWSSVDGLPSRVIEHAEFWEITWELPDGVLGGAPVVHISKSDSNVVRALHTQ